MTDELDPTASTTKDGKKLRRPVEEVRAELMADPDVREQAQILKLPVEQYVEKILDYALHPQKPAQLQIIPDEELKARDPSIPTVAELQDHLQKIVDGEIVISPAHQRDGFKQDDTHEQYESALGSKDANKGAPEATTSAAAQLRANQKPPSDKS
jgi:hypothetical protein